MRAIPSRIADDLAALALGEEPAMPGILPRPDVDPARLGRFAGTYRFGDDFYVPGAAMEIEVSDCQPIVPVSEMAPEGSQRLGALCSSIRGQFCTRVTGEVPS